jgi:hypothetical protein
MANNQANYSAAQARDINAQLLAAELRAAKQATIEAGEEEQVEPVQTERISLRQEIARERRMEKARVAKQAASKAKAGIKASEAAGMRIFSGQAGSILLEIIPGKFFHTIFKALQTGGGATMKGLAGIARVFVIIFSNGLYILAGLAAIALIVLIVDFVQAYADASWFEKAKMFIGAVTEYSWATISAVMELFKPLVEVFTE